MPSHLRLVTLIPGFLAGWIAVSSAVATAAGRAEWPQWRGPDGQGHATAKNLPDTWSETENVSWKSTLPGRGWSSPVIVGDQIWLTTALETPAKPEDAARRLKANTGDQPVTLLEKVELLAVCLDRRSGQLVRTVSLITVPEPQWVHKLNSYASPSPVWEEGKLYCHFGAFGTACVDTATARVDWANTTLQVMHENGPGGSPIVHGNHVVFHLDGSDSQMIAALDKRTGAVAWKTDRSGKMNANPQLKKSYGTPLVVEIGGREQIVSPASDWVYGYDPETGRELWKLPYGELGFSLTPRPVVGHGMIFMATGFGRGQILALKYQGLDQPQIEWRFNRGSPTMPSPLLVGDELYFISDNGIFTCLDAKSGQEHFRERLSGNFSSSPWFADGRIYVSNREGMTYVIAAGKTFQKVASNQLPEGILATPAAVDGAIYVRTETALYRIQKAPATTRHTQSAASDTQLALAPAAPEKLGGYWPSFRGPTGMGVSAERGLPLNWGAEDNIAWKTPLPGPGASTPVVYGDRIYLTCYSGYFVPDQPGGSLDQLKRHLLALRRDTGEILWNRPVPAVLPEEERIRDHGYAASSPAVDEDGVVVFFGKSGVLAFDHEGQQKWSTLVGSKTNGWGSAASPVFHRQLVFINASVESSSLVALDRATGKKVWQAAEVSESWNTPVLVEAAKGKSELVVARHGQVLGFEPSTGKPLWSCRTDIGWYMVPSAVAADGVVYCLGGRSGVAALAVRAGGTGDVTDSRRLWTSMKGSNVSSPVYHNGHLYWMQDSRETAYCAKADTGEIVYEQRLERAGQVYASALLADGRLYYLTRTGRTFVLAAKPEFEQLAVNDLRDRSVFNGSPAVSGRQLLIRSDKFLYCIGARP